MKRIIAVLRQPEFHGVLFVLCLILFSYPLLVMSNEGHPRIVYLSLFLPWGIIILLLFFTTKSYTVSGSDNNGDDGEVTDA